MADTVRRDLARGTINVREMKRQKGRLGGTTVVVMAVALGLGACAGELPTPDPYVPAPREAETKPVEVLQALVSDQQGSELGEVTLSPWGAGVRVRGEQWQKITRFTDDSVADEVLVATDPAGIRSVSAHTAAEAGVFELEDFVTLYENASCEVDSRYATALLLPSGAPFHDVCCLDDSGVTERAQTVGGQTPVPLQDMSEESFRAAIDLGIEWHGALSIVSLQQSEDGVVVVAANSVEAPDLEEVSYYRGRDHLTVRLSEDGTMSVYRGSRPQYEGVDPYSVGQPVAPGAADALLPTIEGLFEEHAISWDDLSRLTIEQFRYGWSVEVVTTSGQSDSEDVWLGNA